MTEFSEKYSQLQQEMNSLGQQLHEDFMKATQRLINMVHEQHIESFSFFPTYSHSKPYVSIRVRLPRHADDLRLGVLAQLNGIPGIGKLSQETQEVLEQINHLIHFANEHLAQHIPPIKQHTYYSLNAVNQREGFEKEPVRFLLPTFYELANKPASRSKKP